MRRRGEGGDLESKLTPALPRFYGVVGIPILQHSITPILQFERSLWEAKGIFRGSITEDHSFSTTLAKKESECSTQTCVIGFKK